MRVVLVSVGSRGDVQPFIALGLRLRDRGHEVVIASEFRLESLVKGFDLGFALIAGDLAGLYLEPGVYNSLRNGNLLQFFRIKHEWERRFSVEATLQSYLDACEGADFILSSNTAHDETWSVAEKLGVPWGILLLGATLPSAEYPAIFAEDVITFSWMNMYTHQYMGAMVWKGKSKAINAWRTASLELPSITDPMGSAEVWLRNNCLVINAFSPLILPKMVVPLDYGSNTHTRGFLFVDEQDAAVPQQVIDFLSEDPLVVSGQASAPRPVVCIGFGSMAGFDAVKFTCDVKQACLTAECRVILLSGWSAVDQKRTESLLPLLQPGALLVVSSVAHSWLFPRVDCVVHHCGAGTMAAALRAGVPQIPCPHFVDQPHNAKAVLRLGCALDVIPFHKLSAKNLAKALRRVLANEHAVRQTAISVGKKIRAESEACVEAYCETIEAEQSSFKGFSATVSPAASTAMTGANSKSAKHVALMMRKLLLGRSAFDAPLAPSSSGTSLSSSVKDALSNARLPRFEVPRFDVSRFDVRSALPSVPTFRFPDVQKKLKDAWSTAPNPFAIRKHFTTSEGDRHPAGLAVDEDEPVVDVTLYADDLERMEWYREMRRRAASDAPPPISRKRVQIARQKQHALFKEIQQRDHQRIERYNSTPTHTAPSARLSTHRLPTPSIGVHFSSNSDVSPPILEGFFSEDEASQENASLEEYLPDSSSAQDIDL